MQQAAPAEELVCKTAPELNRVLAGTWWKNVDERRVALTAALQSFDQKEQWTDAAEGIIILNKGQFGRVSVQCET